MILLPALRFKGYWASVLAWLVLTFAIPMSGVAGSEQLGWMRLCSSLGVHWVQVEDQTTPDFSESCLCLSLAILPTAPELSAPVAGMSPAVVWLEANTPSSRPPYQPRSPPSYSQV
ncbi:hypothetical protein MED297_20872 [Reinekea sp. MED297]|uniref:Uncharacterized protein n=2 Tax=Reinekea TaxID=230494 RepID=A4B9S9_9GAMM|nr:hypothetical protein MED297_20872 [Reinekea sp. MED297] [Reinekea blandensis MED297]